MSYGDHIRQARALLLALRLPGVITQGDGDRMPSAKKPAFVDPFAINLKRSLLVNHLTRQILPCLILFVAPSCAIAAIPNWPQFRGPGSRGVAEGETLPTHWSATENVAWKIAIPGRGWSSPVVYGNHVFVTTVVNSGTSEEPKKGLYFGGNRPDPPDSVHQWKVFCLDLETGRIQWEQQVHKDKPQTSIHLKNSFASETPVVDGERVYCYFGNVGIFCFDHEGNPLWNRRLDPHKTRHGWGTAASPVLHGDCLYLVNDNDEDSYLLALDKNTGDLRWRVSRDEKSNWSTPLVWQNDRRTEIVTLGSGRVRSYNLDGKLLWWLEGMSSITIATPYAYDGLLYISSGYFGDRLRPIYAIRPGAEGDISLEGSQRQNGWITWCNETAAPYNPSTLIYRDRLYVLYDRGLVACFDPKDGAKIYGPERLPHGRAFTASPWAYAGNVFCLNEDGLTFVLQAGDEFKLSHINSLAEDDMGMATPAIADDRLLIRTSARVYCIQAAAKQAGKEQAARSYDPLAVPDDADIQVHDLTFQDERRQREILLRVYLPAGNEAAPVVLFSHGLGGTRQGCAYLGRHWSARGYLAVFLQHPGSDDSVWTDVPRGERMAAMNQAASGQNFLLRVQDVPATLDQLAEWNKQEGHVLTDRLDLAKIGMSGHSFGAVTAQAVSGQSTPFGRQRFSDPRIRAAIAFSPSSPRRGDSATAFGSVKIPWMLMTGTKDTAPIGNADVASRLDVYPHLPDSIDKYELVLHNAEHSAFTDRSLPGDREKRKPNHHRAILALSTAFWDTHLREDEDARRWLHGPGAKSVLQAEERWQLQSEAQVH